MYDVRHFRLFPDHFFFQWVKKNKQFIPIENAEINFYAGFESEVKLGAAKSNKNGKAIFEIKPEVQLPDRQHPQVKVP